MSRHTIIIAACSAFVLSAPQIQAQSKDHASTVNATDNLTITVTKLDISDKTLNLCYEIRNDSEDEVWILVGWYRFSDSTFGMGPSVRIDEDGRTLTIRARLKGTTPGIDFQPLYGRLVRLRSGDSQTESIFMTVPARPLPQLEHTKQQEQVTKYATRLAIELGYYQGNLPERIHKKLKPLSFNWVGEQVNSREDELLTVEDSRELKNEEEQVIRTVIENIRIPYEDTRNYSRKIKSPGLHSYERIEIQYKPSILEFFFPYKNQQSLLSPDEMEYLQSDKTIVLNNAQDIYTVAHFIPHTRADTPVIVGIPVRYRSHAEVVCYSAGKPFLSFSICNGDKIVIEGKYLISFKDFPSLKMLAPQIQAIDLRTRCAANLKNQWYRFRFFNLQEALRQDDLSIRNKTLYPRPSEWCDDMLRQYPVMGRSWTDHWCAKPYICPGAGEGKNHYAMDPNCKPDSPPDMVLLFETKAGWNQHGGPELFTFDNHDPKGGCVLLNDGTVKFIRTEEELRQLRWK